MATTDSTIAIIRQAWMDWGLSITTIKEGATFFTGKASYSPIDTKTLLSKDSLWLSHSAYYAALYGYQTADPLRTHHRCILKLSIAQDIALVQFPVGLHPADVFKEIPGPRNTGWRQDMTFAGMRPDHFVSKYWTQIIAGTPLDGCIGHCREAAPKDAADYGAPTGSLIEVWLSKGAALSVEQCKNLPDDIDAFLARHQTDKQGVDAATFDQSAVETYCSRE